MRLAFIVIASIIVVVGGIGAAVVYTPTGRYLLLGAIGQIAKPHHGWDLAYKASAPDYARAESWAALPGRPSPADFVPEGSNAARDAQVDVFFIHPTGYMKGYDWNSPLDAKSATEENTKWMMANQASAFNGCCNVYAPRYREVSIFTYLVAPKDVQKQAMDFAYADVARAFTYFLQNYSHGRPCE